MERMVRLERHLLSACQDKFMELELNLLEASIMLKLRPRLAAHLQ